jgi:hypothetical protein
MTGVIGEQSHGHGFFGSSSAGSFMTQIKSAIDAKVGSASRRPSFTGTIKASLFTTSPTTHTGGKGIASIEYVLPPRKTADSLVGVYWELVYPLYPFLDRPLFEDAYQSVWSGAESTTDERIFMCTLNVVFALACQLSESVTPEKREDSAIASARLLGYWLHGAHSMPSSHGTVSTKYKHTTPMLDGCWTCCTYGAGVRISSSRI